MKIEVGKGYRRLRANEILREGDEWYSFLWRRWIYTALAGRRADGLDYRRRGDQGAREREGGAMNRPSSMEEYLDLTVEQKLTLLFPVRCPFCNESDFDLIGLKGHLACGQCEKYNETKLPHQERET